MTGKVLPACAAIVKSVASYANELSTQFDGVDQHIILANPANFHFNVAGADQPFSISAWVKMDDATDFRIACKGGTADREWIFTINASDKMAFGVYSDAAGNNRFTMIADTTQTADEGSWHHYCVTYDGSEIITGIIFYRNGSLLASTGLPGGSYTGMRDSGDNVWVSGWDGAGYADGKIDELAVFDKELSAAEVLAIYNLGVPSNLLLHAAAGNLVSWHRMGDLVDAFPTYPDATGFGNDGTAQNLLVTDIVADVP